MSPWNRLLHRFQLMLVPVRRMPNADLVSCLWNLAARGFEPRQIVDVGANRGKWSRAASRVFPRAGYTLLEPQVEMEPHLGRFCAGHANRRYLLAGAAAHVGQLPFSAHPSTVSSTFAHTPEYSAKIGCQMRMVPVTTIDHVSQTLIRAIPDILKVDAESFEQEVIKGSQSLLGQTEVIFMELHFFGKRTDPTEPRNLIEFMSERDYVLYDFSWFGRRNLDRALELCEAVFVRRDGYLRSLRPGQKSVYVSPAPPAEWQVPHKAAA